MKKKPDLRELLCLNYTWLTNKTISLGTMDMPALYCNADTYPNFLALYGEPSLYHKTDRTAVCFYEYDSDFEGIDGLYNAIYYGDEERLLYYKELFGSVKYFVTPDYSILGDVHLVENLYRLFKARVVGLWLSLELNAIVIPNITFCDERTQKYALNGLEECSVVCLSTKGHMQNPCEKSRLRNSVRAAVDSLHLKAIIVYDVCGTDDETRSIFSYAFEHGVKVVIPDNTLKNRNQLLYCARREKGGDAK